MVKWFDKTTERYMKSLSKEEDLELGMARRVFHEGMTPEDAVVDIVKEHDGLVTVTESIDAWNRVVTKNTIARATAVRLFFVGLLFWVLAFILAL